MDWFKVDLSGSAAVVLRPRVTRRDAVVQGKRVVPGTVVRLYENVGDGHLWVDAAVGQWDEQATGWRVEFEPASLQWAAGDARPDADDGTKAADALARISDDHPLRRFVPVFLDLAEGRFEPQQWHDWWAANREDVEASCETEVYQIIDPSARWYLEQGVDPAARPAPTFDDPVTALRSLIARQDAVCRVLEAMHITHVRSSRYDRVLPEAERQYALQEVTRREEKMLQYSGTIRAIGEIHPPLGKFLADRVDAIDELEPGLSETELAELGSTLGVPLPGEYRRWLSCTGGLQFGSLDLRRMHCGIQRTPAGQEPWATEGMLCIAEYWKDADGDQVLFDLVHHHGDDPPVFYYAHERNRVRRMGSSFTKWIRSLPRQLADE